MAAAEMLRRRKARANLIDFIEYTRPDWKTADHHRRIAEGLERVESGQSSRLMIFCFPRSGKTQMTSSGFVPWYIGKNKDKGIIHGAYNLDKANDYSADIRDMLTTPAYKKLHPDILIRRGFSAIENWKTTNGCSYRTAGVNTATTGRGSHVFLIDDPVKDRADADSPVMQKRAWDWYRSVAYTRQEGVDTEDAAANMPAIIVIQTRWHEGDLSGRIRDQMDKGGEQWEIVDLPAIVNGESLWPRFFPLSRLKDIRTTIGPRDWNALYMQNPTPDEGSEFKREWIKYYTELPKAMRIYGASDYAASDGEGDYTVHIVFGVDRERNIYILDVWRKQAPTNVWIEKMMDLIGMYEPHEWLEEKGPIAKAAGPAIAARMKETERYCVRVGLPSVTDKVTRSTAIRGRMAMGNVFFPENADWTADLVQEILHFPGGKNDDQVDTLSLIGRHVHQFKKKSLPTEKTVIPISKAKNIKDLTLNALFEMNERKQRRRRRRRYA